MASRGQPRLFASLAVLMATGAIALTEFLAFGAFSSINATTLAPRSQGPIAWSDPIGHALDSGYLVHLGAALADRFWTDWRAWEPAIGAWGAITCVVVTAIICIRSSMSGARTPLNILALLSTTIVVANPFVTLWSVGEHSTPYLMMFCALLASLASSRNGNNGPIDDLVLVVLAIAALFIRIDSLLFAAPILAHWLLASRNTLRSGVILGLGAGSAIAWIALSPLLGQHFPPALAAIRMPDVSLVQCLQNVLYVGSFVLLSSVALLLLPAVDAGASLRKVLALSLQMNRGPWAGLALASAYVALTSSREMMFAFGSLVPYLPVLAILLVRAMPLDEEDEAGAGSMLIPAAAVGIQTVLSVVVYLLMVNPPSNRYWTPPQPEYGAVLESGPEYTRRHIDARGTVARTLQSD